MRILIVDDEPPARARLRALLAILPNSDDIEIVGEAEDGPSAVDAVARDRPDVVFLDVQMPGMDGFEVMRALAAPAVARDVLGGLVPDVIFATAFDQYAVRAFEVHAIDYLVKPFDARRLDAAVQRSRERLSNRRPTAEAGGGTLPSSLSALLAALENGNLSRHAFAERLAVRVGERVYYVRVGEIDWVEAEGNYVRLYTGSGTKEKKSHLIRKTLTTLAAELDPTQFARIHRSSLVNIDRIRELRALFDGEYQVLLADGTKLKLSRTYRANLPSF
jgi:two-component system LytT family response regulator